MRAFHFFAPITVLVFWSHPGQFPNVALHKNATQISTFVWLDEHFSSASLAVDGNPNDVFQDLSCTHTLPGRDPWWRVDLGKTVLVKQVGIVNRGDCCSERLINTEVRVGKVIF